VKLSSDFFIFRSPFLQCITFFLSLRIVYLQQPLYLFSSEISQAQALLLSKLSVLPLFLRRQLFTRTENYKMKYPLFIAFLGAVGLVMGQQHPPVSNPERIVGDHGVGDEEDLYAQRPNERPLHTTVLMAIHTGRPRVLNDRRLELR